MTTTTALPGGPLSHAALRQELQYRLEFTESESGRLLTRFRALSPDDPERTSLIRQLDRSAAIAEELQDLLGLSLG